MQNSKLYFITLFLVIYVVIPINSAKNYRTLKDEIEEPSQQVRKKKLLPVFQIVTFPNEACSAGTRNGTCYTSDECNARGGSSSGTCANGYGVCCYFTQTCGQMTSENCTYFTNPSTIATDSACTLEVCPCGNNICQLRLDFTTFVISGPSTNSRTVGLTVYGDQVFTRAENVAAGITPINPNAKGVSDIGQCLTDVFTVASPGNTVPPAVCGTLTGEHMYVDLNDGRCDELRFSFSDTATGTTIATRSWNIKITQYSCDYNNLAPGGCTQYYFGSATGQIQSFNFNNGHLADQNQQICIRRERGNCRVCYVATSAADFQLSGPTAAAAPVSDGTFCCNYGTNGLNTNGFDCIEIVGAMRSPIDPSNVPNSRFCRRSLGLGTNVAMTICSSSTPFSVRFRSDRYEFVSTVDANNNVVGAAIDEGATLDAGFRLAYTMDATQCTL